MLNMAKLLILGNISKIGAPEETIHLSTITLDVINIWNIIVLMFKVISITVSSQSLMPKMYEKVKERASGFYNKKFTCVVYW